MALHCHLCKKNSSKLHANIYKTLTLDESTVNRIVYKDRAWVCKFRANSAPSVMASCLGRITASFDRTKNVLRIVSFIGEHLCQSSTERQRAAQVQRIFDLVKLIPESALVYVEQTCQSILEHWSDPSNDGVTISIVPIMRASSVPTDDEDQALEPGKILTLIRYKFQTNKELIVDYRRANRLHQLSAHRNKGRDWPNSDKHRANNRRYCLRISAIFFDSKPWFSLW